MSLGDSPFLPAVKNLGWTAPEKHFPFLVKLRSLQTGIKSGSVQLIHRGSVDVTTVDVPTQFQ